MFLKDLQGTAAVQPGWTLAVDTDVLPAPLFAEGEVEQERESFSDPPSPTPSPPALPILFSSETTKIRRRWRGPSPPDTPETLSWTAVPVL